MGFRFRKSIPIAKGIRLNLNKHDVSVTLGDRMFHTTLNSDGKLTKTASLPGTGLSYSTTTPIFPHKRFGSGDLSNEQSASEENPEACVNEYETYIHNITHLYLNPVPEIDWNELLTSTSPYSQSSKEDQVESEENAYKPGFLAKHFKMFNPESNGTFQKELDQAKAEDQKVYEKWQNLKEEAQGVLSGDTAVMEEVIETGDTFTSAENLLTSHSVSVKSPISCQVDLTVNFSDVIPNESYSLTKTGRLSKRKMSKTNYYSLCEDFVCSLALDIARNIFNSLPIQEVLVNIQNQSLDTSTGKNLQDTVLSVLIERTEFSNLNLDAIDASDSMDNFEHHMKFLKTKGLEEVTPLTLKV